MIAVGLGLLRLSPRDFWTMTPIELGHALRALTGAPDGPPQRRSLDALMSLFPDTERRSE